MHDPFKRSINHESKDYQSKMEISPNYLFTRGSDKVSLMPYQAQGHKIYNSFESQNYAGESYLESSYGLRKTDKRIQKRKRMLYDTEISPGNSKYVIPSNMTPSNRGWTNYLRVLLLELDNQSRYIKQFLELAGKHSKSFSPELTNKKEAMPGFALKSDVRPLSAPGLVLQAAGLLREKISNAATGSSSSRNLISHAFSDAARQAQSEPSLSTSLVKEKGDKKDESDHKKLKDGNSNVPHTLKTHFRGNKQSVYEKLAGKYVDRENGWWRANPKFSLYTRNFG